MAEFIHGTEHSIDGPFLIDRSQLEALDKILNDEWSRFESERKQNLDAAIDKKLREHGKIYGDSVEEQRNAIRLELERYDFRARREFYLYLKDGPSAQVADFASAFREADLQDKVPNGLFAVLESGDYACRVKLNEAYCKLEVEVEPARNEFVLQTLTVLKNWQNSVRPPKWQSLWLTYRMMSWIVWFAALGLSSGVLTAKSEYSANNQLYPEALSIITNGVTAQNQNQAIQLLLAKDYGYHPHPMPAAMPGWFLVLLFGGFAYALALSFCPKVSIGVGRGEKQVAFWRKYSVFLLITTPCFIFTTFMWPKIQHFLESVF